MECKILPSGNMRGNLEGWRVFAARCCGEMMRLSLNMSHSRKRCTENGEDGFDTDS
jgi:hypothetical protein